MRFSCITSLDELRDYRDGWEEVRRICGRSPFSSYELTMIWLKAFETRFRPMVLVVEEKRTVLGIAPFAQSCFHISRYPIRKLQLVGGIDGTLGYQGLGPMYDISRKDVLDRILKGMINMDWSILEAERMEDHPTVTMFMDRIRRTTTASDFHQWPTQVLHLEPGKDIDSYFGYETRRTMRKIRRRMDREGNVVFRKLRTVEEAERAARLYARMHIERWKNKLKESYFRDPLIAELLVSWARTTMEMGSARIYELVIDGQVASQSFKFKEGVGVWSRRLGMDDAFSKFSPGKMVSWLAMEDLQAEGVTMIDFGGGQEQYKYDMGAKDVPMHAIHAQKGLYDIALRAANFEPLRRVRNEIGIRGGMLKAAQDRQIDNYNME